MLNNIGPRRGMAVAPHALAAETGLAILRDGGNAAEAAVAMAAVLAVVYPHMTGLGGDSFWLLAETQGPVTAIDACGRTPLTLTPDGYLDRGFDTIPHRGPLAANTVAGTLSGWQAALDHSARQWGGRLPLSRLLEAAINYAVTGCMVTDSQFRSTTGKLAELGAQPGFGGAYLADGAPLPPGSIQRQPILAATLQRLAEAGLEDFYRGELARAVATDLESSGSPVTLADLEIHSASTGAPLTLALGGTLPEGTLYTTPPPSQGLATLLILGQFVAASTAIVADSVDHVHFLVEATKYAFRQRDRLVRDPALMEGVDLQALLEPAALARAATAIDMQTAAPWGGPGELGDTTWFGVIDGAGRAVSCIQSLYHEFGSGVVLPATGIVWQNRGCGFSLAPGHPRLLGPGRKPFHTLCPSLARLDDGRTVVFGSMGGDGQPQTQSAVFSRYAGFDRSLQQAIDAPRWLLGRTWGDWSNHLKLEARFDAALIEGLRARGHDVELVADFDEVMGHAGAVVRHADGLLEGASDPRSDGAAVGY